MEVFGIVFKSGDILVSSNINKIVPDDYNDPDMEIFNPYQILKSVGDSFYLSPYLVKYTNQIVFSFRSDDVLTFFSPNEFVVEKYKDLTNQEEQLNIKFEKSKEDDQEEVS